MNALANNIKACRERRSMTREELARKMSVGPKKIEDYESGKVIPSNGTLLRISTILDIPASELIGRPIIRTEHHV